MKACCVLIGAAIFAAGCDDARTADEDGGPSGDPITVEELCDEVAQLFCEANRDCCTDPAGVPETIEACINVTRPQCLSGFEGEAWREGRIVLDEEGAAASLDVIGTAAASCTLVSPYRFPAVGRGTVPEGGDCSSSSSEDLSSLASCAEGFGCAMDFTTYTGTCEPLAVLNDPCGNAEPPCGAGLFCDYSATTPRCGLLLDDGDPCTSDAECWSYFCDGTCQQRTGESGYCL